MMVFSIQRMFLIMQLIFASVRAEGDQSDGKHCLFAFGEVFLSPEKIEKDFIECTKWTGSGYSKISFMGEISQELFSRMTSKVMTIMGLQLLNISDIVDLKIVDFRNLKEIDASPHEWLNLHLNYLPQLTAINFPNLDKSILRLATFGLPALTEDYIKNLEKDFHEDSYIAPYGECDFNPAVSNLTVLVNCENVSSLNIANATGAVPPIRFIRRFLEIRNSELPDMSFLQLPPHDPTRNQWKIYCKIIDNKFCVFNETEIAERMRVAFGSCEIHGNTDGHCDATTMQTTVTTVPSSTSVYTTKEVTKPTDFDQTFDAAATKENQKEEIDDRWKKVVLDNMPFIVCGVVWFMLYIISLIVFRAVCN